MNDAAATEDRIVRAAAEVASERARAERAACVAHMRRAATRHQVCADKASSRGDHERAMIHIHIVSALTLTAMEIEHGEHPGATST